MGRPRSTLGYGAGSQGGGWSKTANMTVGNNANTQSMQMVFPEAGSYTLAFGAPSHPGVFCEADITWSVAGNSVSRTVSVADGVSISGVAEGIKVIIRDVTPAGGAPIPPVGTPYYVGMQVAPGSRPSVSKPPTLVPVGNNSGDVAPAGFFDVPVPTGAGVISVFLGIIVAPGGAPITSGEITVVMVSNGVPRGSYDPILQSGFIPVPPGTTDIQLVNVTAAKDFYFTWQFGIDG